MYVVYAWKSGGIDLLGCQCRHTSKSYKFKGYLHLDLSYFYKKLGIYILKYFHKFYI